MRIEPTELPGVHLLVPDQHHDHRGVVSETWRPDQLAAAGLSADFVLDLQSRSTAVHTLRGLHLQVGGHGRTRIVRCGHGRMRDVVVDLRRDAPTFGRWIARELSAENGRQLWIPPGFGHGFVTLEPDTLTLYRMSGPWVPEACRTVHFADPELGIDWTVPHAGLTLSDNDAGAPPLRAHR